jgi:transposase
VLFVEDGRIELDTNTVERAIRPIALGRKNALFAGSDGGARHWAIVASLVATAKLNGVEPLAWLTDVLERMVSGRTKAHELEKLLPWTGGPSEPRLPSSPECREGRTTLAPTSP